MRIFAALCPSDAFLNELEDALAPLKTAHPEFRWMPRENLHVTLAFLGDIDSFGVSLLDRAAEQTAARVKPIEAASEKLLMFPQGRLPNALALGFSQGKERIAQLASFLLQTLFRSAREERYSFRAQEKRAFTPHITIARKGQTPLELFPAERDTLFRVNGIFENVTVFESELYKDGAVYTPLASYTLAG